MSRYRHQEGLEARRAAPRTFSYKTGLAVLSVAVIIITLAYLYIQPALSPYQSIIISDNSMEPALVPGQEVVVEKGYYGTQPLQHGDLVAIAIPGDGKTMIRRAVAVPGDELQFLGGRIYLNRQFLEETYLKERGFFFTDFDLRLLGPQLKNYYNTVPEGMFLALNDNRYAGRDSRDFGLLSTGFITGKVIE